MRAYGSQYLQTWGDRMPAVHRKAVTDITACRTPAMGGTTYYCPDCEQWQYSYHSCGNRNCNKCGHERAQQWLERTGSRLLPTDHFMVTVTLPGELRQLARAHQKLFYGLLMRYAAQALQTLGWDPRFVGGKLAMMGVLHTWSRDLSYHPHVHMIVAGGGLWPDEGLWLDARPDFLVPVKALSAIFAAKFRDGLKKADPQLFEGIDNSVWQGRWVVHCQPVGHGQAALKYLAQYIFRPALSNGRLVSMAGGKVTFRWQHSQTRQWKLTTLGQWSLSAAICNIPFPAGSSKFAITDYMPTATARSWPGCTTSFCQRPPTPPNLTPMRNPRMTNPSIPTLRDQPPRPARAVASPCAWSSIFRAAGGGPTLHRRAIRTPA